MKVIVTNSKHDQYNRVGELVKKGWAGLWVVRIPDPDGEIEVHLGEQDFREIKRQPDPPGTLSRSGRYQSDGLGCVERVSSVERDWDNPRAQNPYGY